MAWPSLVDALRTHAVFLAGVILVPGLVLLFASIIRTKLHQPWTASADAFIALTTLEFGILYNIDEISRHIDPLFAKNFNPTFVVLALISVVLTVWALFVEEEVRSAKPRRKTIVFLWASALTLVSADLYVLAGLGGWKG